MEVEDIKEIIEKNPLALATIKEGKPYVIAVAYVKVKDGKIIITNNYMKTTVENIKNNKDISLAVWNKKWEGDQLNGEAEHYDSGKYLEFVKSLEENKNESPKGAIVVKINEIKKLA